MFFCPSQKDIGLWIDLTKTARYYSKDEVEKRGAKYRKMTAGGHDERPSPEATQLFLDACDQQFTENPDSVIGTLTKFIPQAM